MARKKKTRRRRTGIAQQEMLWGATLKTGELQGYRAADSVEKRVSSLNRALKKVYKRLYDSCDSITRVQRRLMAVANLLPRNSRARKVFRRDACNLSKIRENARRKGRACPIRLQRKWIRRSCVFR